MFQILIILILLQLRAISCESLYSKFQQHDYKVECTRLEIVNYNKDIYKHLEMVTFKHNRTLAVANFTYELKTPLNFMKATVIVQGYKFLSNEYRTFPMRFQLNLCRVIYANIAGIYDITSRCGNTIGCDFKKDVVYRVCNIYPDESRLPPFMPNGEYKIETTIYYENITLLSGNTYVKVFRPIKYQ